MIFDHYDMLETGELSLEKIASFANKHVAKPLSEKERDRLQDNDFGLIVVASDGNRYRKFPIHNFYETVMSKAAFVMNGGSIPPKARKILESRINVAAKCYSPSLSKVASEEARPFPNIYNLSKEEEISYHSEPLMEKTADVGNFAINRSINGGRMERFPIDSHDQVKRRIRRFDVLHDNMNIKYAFQYAENVSRRAEAMGVDIPEDSSVNLYKEASLSPMAKNSITDRLDFAPIESHAAYLGLMLKMSSATPEQVAVTLDSIDREYGMDVLYGEQFPSAAKSVLDIEKRADTINVNSVDIPKDQLTSLISSNEADLSNLLGADTVDAMKDEPEAVMKSLPAPYRQKILEMVNTQSS